MKTALITGASRGIGRAIALMLAEQKFNIILNYRQNEQAADQTQAQILALGANCLKIRCDVGNSIEVGKMYQQAKKTFGITDIVINNAGVAKGGLIQDATDNDFDYIMDTNLRGTFNISRAFIPDMISSGWGRIINISSIWGQIGAANESLYSASKAGIIGLTKALARELAPSKVTANCIAPGAIKTDMLDMLPASTLEWLKDEIPAGRLGTGDDIASAIKMLIDKSADYITGQVLNISGGFVIT